MGESVAVAMARGYLLLLCVGVCGSASRNPPNLPGLDIVSHRVESSVLRIPRLGEIQIFQPLNDAATLLPVVSFVHCPLAKHSSPVSISSLGFVVMALELCDEEPQPLSRSHLPLITTSLESRHWALRRADWKQVVLVGSGAEHAGAVIQDRGELDALPIQLAGVVSLGLQELGAIHASPVVGPTMIVYKGRMEVARRIYTGSSSPKLLIQQAPDPQQGFTEYAIAMFVSCHVKRDNCEHVYGTRTSLDICSRSSSLCEMDARYFFLNSRSQLLHHFHSNDSNIG